MPADTRNHGQGSEVAASRILRCVEYRKYADAISVCLQSALLQNRRVDVVPLIKPANLANDPSRSSRRRRRTPKGTFAQDSRSFGGDVTFKSTSETIVYVFLSFCLFMGKTHAGNEMNGRVMLWSAWPQHVNGLGSTCEITHYHFIETYSFGGPLPLHHSIPLLVPLLHPSSSHSPSTTLLLLHYHALPAITPLFLRQSSIH
ncbi:hypothetical protein EVAR_13550_1 [Eumeta japonica]|uniref:Uncharacterized protein n=1 Tax=Eumeta variegata TaxID=151549 RepID=A0A4C1U8W7_EUMVA|nr:hypothetical protein EVAR_13550_1 [Eumeta japonica]